MKTRRLPALHSMLPALAASILWGPIGWGQSPGSVGTPVGTPDAAVRGADATLQEANPSITLTMLSKAIERNPRNARAFNERGKVYARMGRLEEAVVDYTRALEIEPAFAQALGNRGMAHRELRQFQAALADLDRLIAMRPDLAKAYHDRGETYRQMGLLTQATADYSKAAQLDPSMARQHAPQGSADRSPPPGPRQAVRGMRNADALAGTTQGARDIRPAVSRPLVQENPFVLPPERTAPDSPPADDSQEGPRTTSRSGNSHRPPTDEIVETSDEPRDPLADPQATSAAEGAATNAVSAPSAETSDEERQSAAPGRADTHSSRARGSRRPEAGTMHAGESEPDRGTQEEPGNRIASPARKLMPRSEANVTALEDETQREVAQPPKGRFNLWGKPTDQDAQSARVSFRKPQAKPLEAPSTAEAPVAASPPEPAPAAQRSRYLRKSSHCLRKSSRRLRKSSTRRRTSSRRRRRISS